MTDLRRFRWHTGAPLRPLDPEETLPPLFRDLGPEATARFLRGALPRLCGPLSPITYLRTAAWAEPYVDHGAIGRLVFLQPRTLRPFHAGVPHVLVAEPSAWGARGSIGYLPGHVPLAEAAVRLRDARTTGEMREALGGRAHDAAVADALARLDALVAEHAAVERLAEPLRRRLQSPRQAERDAARADLAALDIDEEDLCRAWHHLPAPRRAHVRASLGLA